MDPIEEALEWAKAEGKGRMGRLIFSHTVGGLSSWTCWLCDTKAQKDVAVTGTEPKTLSEVAAEALAEILKRTEAL